MKGDDMTGSVQAIRPTLERDAIGLKLSDEFVRRYNLRPELRYVSGDPIRVGHWHARVVSFGLVKTLAFSLLSGDWNRLHYCTRKSAQEGPLHGYAIPGILLAGCFSGILASVLPGHGTIYAGQTLKFFRPARPYRKYVALVRVAALDPARKRVVLESSIDDPIPEEWVSKPVCSGEADVRNHTSRFAERVLTRNNDD
jgi:acyl dehydratase